MSEEKSFNFIEYIIEEDLKNGYLKSDLCFWFFFEFNGYLYIGYVLFICLNFGLGLKYNVFVNLCFDDINFVKEE